MQDLLKLQEVHKELATRFGVPPTFAEWATAANIDQIQLGRRLHYGEECRDKMIRSNIRLVISVARGYYGTKVHLQDIVQVYASTFHFRLNVALIRWVGRAVGLEVKRVRLKQIINYFCVDFLNFFRRESEAW